MITTQDIEHLASLARIDISSEEAEKMTGEIDSILSYVGAVQNAATDSASDEARVVPTLHNIMRDDVVTHAAGQYTEAILSNAPAREGNYLKVKKIL